MSRSLDPEHPQRLDIQGFESMPEERPAEVAPWLRFAFARCAAPAIVATTLASPPAEASPSPRASLRPAST